MHSATVKNNGYLSDSSFKAAQGKANGTDYGWDDEE